MQVQVVNSPAYPIPVTLSGESLTVTVPAAVEINNDVGNPIPVNGPVTDAQLRAAAVVVRADQISAVTLNIANGASVSATLDCGTARMGRITMPAAWTAADITVQTSPDNVTYTNLYDASGTEYTIKAAASRSILMPIADFLSMRYLRLRSGTSGTPVNQAASRDLIITLVP